MDRKNSAIRLFISDIPETTDAMIPGGVYAMIAETPPARFPILATSLAGAIDANVTATLLVSTAPKIFIERLTQVGFPDADQAIETGRLNVFQLQDDFSKKMFRFGAEAFLNELDHFRLPAASYLVIDQADEVLSLHDITLALEQAEALGQWARRLKVTVLLVFTRVAAVASSLATLTGLMDYLSGIVRLGGHQDGLDLTFEYWQSSDGTIAAKVFGLSIQDDGRYRVKHEAPAPAESQFQGPASELPAQEPEELPDQLRYLYIDPAFASLSSQVAGHWMACDSVVGVMRAAFGARAPTVLLGFERHDVLRDLAEAVHTLRLSLGRRARIVVVERDASLRYQNEILLLRLGTSLVVHRDVQENRIPLMLESLRGQVFNRDIEMDFDAALSSVVTSAKRGYLPPAHFAREIAGVVDRSDLLNLPCALVVATPESDQSCIELLTKVRATRGGDMTTTDGKQCFIYFSGCPESSLKRALQAVVGEHAEHIFGAMQFIVRRPEIRKRLDLLAKEVAGKTFPDAIEATAEPVSAIVSTAAPLFAPIPSVPIPATPALTSALTPALTPAVPPSIPPHFGSPALELSPSPQVPPTIPEDFLEPPVPWTDFVHAPVATRLADFTQEATGVTQVLPEDALAVSTDFSDGNPELTEALAEEPLDDSVEEPVTEAMVESANVESASARSHANTAAVAQVATPVNAPLPAPMPAPNPPSIAPLHGYALGRQPAVQPARRLRRATRLIADSGSESTPAALDSSTLNGNAHHG